MPNLNSEAKRATIVRRYHRLWECGVKEWKEIHEVHVLAIADGWAMVRESGKTPFVCDEMELTYPENA